MAKLLNPTLYSQLSEVFGRRGVRIHRPGQKGQFQYRPEGPGSQYKNMRLTKVGDEEVGEEFSCSCPFCGDTRGRLYFNHNWGTVDKYTGKRILWLCHCYNEECQSDPANRRELAEMILGSERVRFIAPEVEVEDRPERVVKLPGVVTRLDKLAMTQRRHPAIQWCLGRGYDPRVLGTRYGVGYCLVPYAENDPVYQRIVAPFYVRKDGETKLAGWTARKIFEDLDGPKWLHSATPTGSIVYGLGEAMRYKTIVVGEGPGDKWAIGERATAILGKTLKEAKARRIINAVERANDPDSVIVVALDPMQSAVERRRGKKHHIDAAVELLRSLTTVPIVPLRLPSFTDPGGLDSAMFWHYLTLACRALGVDPKPGKVNNATTRKAG